MINKLEKKLRKGAAAILAFCVASTSCIGNAFAAVRDADEDGETELVECVIDLDWEKLEQSIADAIRGNHILKDESDFLFVSDDADTVAQYRQLLAASKENPLYTVDYKFKKKDLPDKTSIQLFVRKDGNAEVAYDDRSWEAELTDGDEDQELFAATPAQAVDLRADDIPDETDEEFETDRETEEPADDSEQAVAGDETLSAEAPETGASEEESEPAGEGAAEEPAVSEGAEETQDPEAGTENEDVRELETERAEAEDSSQPAADRDYELTGDEQLIVLFTNKSNKDVAYQFNINGYLTEKTYVYCADTLREEMKEALEPEKKVPESTAAVEVVEPAAPETAAGGALSLIHI